MQTVCGKIAGSLDAMRRCHQVGNSEWEQKHEDEIERLVQEYLPHGSGFDNGTVLDLARSQPQRLIFSTAFHHMNEGGCYDGWSDHEIIVTPSLVRDFDLRVTGRNRNQIKEYIAETFQAALSTILSCRENCRARQTVQRFLDKQAGFDELKQVAYGWKVTSDTPGDDYR